MATIYKSEVWAEKVGVRYNEVTDDAICLGKIEFKDFPEAFIKTLRLYNKNANRHITHPQFIFKGRVYVCTEFGKPSKTGRGYASYWAVGKTNAKKMPVTSTSGPVKITRDYLLTIPKSKVNSPDWRKYLE